MSLHALEIQALNTLVEYLDTDAELELSESHHGVDKEVYLLARTVEPDPQRFLITKDGQVFEHRWVNGLVRGPEVPIHPYAGAVKTSDIVAGLNVLMGRLLMQYEDPELPERAMIEVLNVAQAILQGEDFNPDEILLE